MWFGLVWFFISVVGSTLIVMGLYAVLWGKNREMNAMNFAGDGGEEKQAVKGDLEMQFPELSKNNFHTRS